MKNYIQPGTSIKHTAAADIDSGDVVLIGSRIGIASVDIDTGEEGVLATEGVFEVAKASADDMSAIGTPLYWNNTSKEMTLTASGNTLAGYVFKGAGAGVTTVQVKINA